MALLLPGVVPSWAAGADAITVTGVVTLDGKPTAGVEVCDLFDDAICATSAADGTYTVKPQFHENLSPMGNGPRVCVSVSPGPTLGDAFESINWHPRVNNQCQIPIKGAAGSTVTLPLDLKAYPLAWGQVVNSAGQPIAGATVNSGQRAVTLTDARGKFSVKMGPYRYDEHYLWITAPGYQLTGSKFSKDGALGKIVMAAEGAGELRSISGRVLDAAGQPYVGARLCLAEGDCFAAVGSDGTYYGLMPASVTGVTKFRVYRPESVDPVLMSQDLYLNVGNLVTNVDFRLNSARRIVGQTPKISGSPKVGKRLTVKVGSWLPQPVATTCKWYVGSKVVQRQCSSLKVKASYRGKRIRVKVTGWRSGYDSKTFASRATSKVYR